MSPALSIRAGSRAYEILRDEGLRPERVRVVVGAAGGPKWLVLSRLDRALFGGWLQPLEKPIHLIGSSIGSWRFAALAQKDWRERHLALEHAYIHQRYKGKPTPAEVSAHCKTIVEAAVPDGAIADLLTQRKYALHFATARGLGLLNRQADGAFLAGLAGAAIGNAAHRRVLDSFFRRTYFHAVEKPPFRSLPGFSIETVPLAPENVKEALLASGSIPLVLAGVGPIPGAPAGMYWDGGVVDYHMDLPYDVAPDELILYPHFLPRMIPGWFDKFLPWRSATRDWSRNVVLVSPTPEFAAALPLRRIPDRDDFKRFFGRDDERISAWERSVEQSGALAREFLELAVGGGIRERVTPLA